MSLVRNALYNIIYQIVSLLLPIITVPYISRVLGSDGIGEYSYTNSYAQYFIIIGMLGINLYGNRQIAYLKNDKKMLSDEFWNIYIIQLMANIISISMYLFLFVIINENNRILYLVQSINLIAAMLDISWFFIGYEEMKTVVTRNTLVKFIGLILIFIFVNDSGDTIIYAFILSFTTLIGQVIMWISLINKIKFSKPKFIKVKKHFFCMSGLFISQLAMKLYVLVDKTMLGIITDASQVGFYENSQKTIKIALTLATSIGVVMLPRMSNLYYERKKEDFKKLMHKSFKFTSLIALPIFLGIVATANNFSPWFYGPGFDGISLLIKLGAIIIVPISISNVLGIQIMIPIGKEKQFSISVIIGLFINFIINVITIEKYGAIGATIASVISEFTITFAQFYFLKNIISIKDVLLASKKSIIASIFMYLIVSILGNNLNATIISTFIEVIIGIVIYITILIIIKEEFVLESIDRIYKGIKNGKKN
ncbi:flippase [Clostridium perfringens]|uniref:flippase n=1 Tax=Clostridium perfringens TaxID=1502 RepID=UPI0018E43309|nr:flippase [Clostridium perfringens]MBI6004252.1 flippase [Clostridium perfringens]